MRLVDTRIAALAAGITDRAIRYRIAKGTLTNHGTPRHIRVDLDELLT